MVKAFKFENRWVCQKAEDLVDEVVALTESSTHGCGSLDDSLKRVARLLAVDAEVREFGPSRLKTIREAFALHGES